MAAISRTLVEGTWLKMLRYQCTTHLCQAASGKNSAALSASPMQASEADTVEGDTRVPHKASVMSSTRRTGQVHLDQRLFDRTLAPPIALDDRRLERLPAQLRYPQPDLAGLGLQAALVVAGAGIATRRAALIPLRIAQPIRLGVEQSVQRLLHGAPHHPFEVALDPLVVNRDDVVQQTRCIV